MRTHPARLPLQEAIERDGFCVVPGVLDEAAVAAILAALARAAAGGGARRRGGEVFAIRNLLRDVPAARRLADSAAVRALVEPVLGAGAFPARGILFDKTPGANWKAVWHQDTMIPVNCDSERGLVTLQAAKPAPRTKAVWSAIDRQCGNPASSKHETHDLSESQPVKERRDAPGFGSWSVKAGVPHCRPPDAVLAGMLHVRLHLDDCGAENGPLLVKPGSHAHGRLGDAARRRWVEKAPAITCLVPAGGALLMRPLLLHASGAARRPGHRRVLHLEFAAAPLPGGLEWAAS